MLTPEQKWQQKQDCQRVANSLVCGECQEASVSTPILSAVSSGEGDGLLKVICPRDRSHTQHVKRKHKWFRANLREDGWLEVEEAQ